MYLVYFSQIRKTNETVVTNGIAFVYNQSWPNRLTVRFPVKLFGYDLFTSNGNYEVLNTDYTNYSVVYSCQQIIPYVMRMDLVWILSRRKTLDQAMQNRITSALISDGIDVSRFEKPSQNCAN